MWATLRRCPRQNHLPERVLGNIRSVHDDQRNRITQFWTPTVTKDLGAHKAKEDPHALLIRAGFLLQSHSGIFHLLPLGLRVQDKLERLIDKHMRSLGASKLSLSSITSESLWKKTGRYSANSELLKIKDRRDSKFLLSPTHEEEITEVVRQAVTSYKSLPLRLYQISRKYRDEKRPRQGLLRAKEFLMKDLYTFDSTHEAGLQTYSRVREAYNALFNELKIPYVVADADSGAMGGNLSHEYHFVSPSGEDNVWSCDTCDYVANEELVVKKEVGTEQREEDVVFVRGISLDRNREVKIHIPRLRTLGSEFDQKVELPWSMAHEFVNLHAVKSAYPDLDTGIEESSLRQIFSENPPTSSVSIYDHRASLPTSSSSTASSPPILHHHPKTSAPLDLTKILPGDPCPRCSNGHLSVTKAIEVGHTFHLGTRYSAPLNACVSVPDSNNPVPIHMGCHGIGVSRLIGAVATLLSSPHGLNWPHVIAPFECLVFSAHKAVKEGDVENVCQELDAANVDVVVDDRAGVSVGWKFADAELIGYPVVVVVGRGWVESGKVEVQCRRLGVKEMVEVVRVKDVVRGLLDRL